MAKPVDIRLWRRVGATRGYFALTVAFQAASVGLVIVQALVISALVADLVNDGVVELARMSRDIALLLVVAFIRAVLVWAQDRFSPRAAGRVVSDLRALVLAHVVALGPRWRRRDGPSDDPAALAITATQGLDALEPYLVHYLPALLLTVLATPAVLVVIGWLDPIALVICLITLPLVPLFMWLIGQMTAGTSERRLAVVSRLGAQVLDLLTGLPTLRAFGREVGPGVRVRALSEAARSATMGTMRVAFLSAMVLELLSTLSVAIVAVSVGLRLVEAAMSLRAGLAAIMLAPEVFTPLRQVAAQFHASTDGLAAADAAFTLLDEPVDPGGCNAGRLSRGDYVGDRTRITAPMVTAIEFADVGVAAGDRDLLAPAHLSARIELSPPDAPGPGQIVALVGPTGGGKSTTALLLLGLLRPDAGQVQFVMADGTRASPSDYGLDDWWRQIVWVPQRPARDPTTVGLSVGQRHRIALDAALDTALASDPAAAPVILRPQRGAQNPSAPIAVPATPRILLLDEPTAHLDAASEETVLATLRAWRDSGRTAIVIAHRPSVIALADQVIEVRAETSGDLARPVASRGRSVEASASAANEPAEALR